MRPVFGKRDLVFGKRDLVSDRIANEISFSGNEMKRDRKRDLKRLLYCNLDLELLEKLVRKILILEQLNAQGPNIF